MTSNNNLDKLKLILEKYYFFTFEKQTLNNRVPPRNIIRNDILRLCIEFSTECFCKYLEDTDFYFIQIPDNLQEEKFIGIIEGGMEVCKIMKLKTVNYRIDMKECQTYQTSKILEMLR